ncbi:pectate lyase [Arthrobacter sp. StoSoilA2]|uniref:pectate lyase family protein n=1 Tax=Arthrobacter sp. StoSoilA2 TaxID=2830990 RepID=UPI001CC38F35|nr:pectate lyase [Arthrobacter sp. StoSoilA2]
MTSTTSPNNLHSRFPNRPLRRLPATVAAVAGIALAATLASAPPSSAEPVDLHGSPTVSIHDSAPTGWASVGSTPAGPGTNGGSDAPSENVHVVSTLAELKAATLNNGDPKAPKIIYIRGTINGNEAPDGKILGEQDYAPGYNIQKYMSCFLDNGKTWSDQAFPYCKQMRQLRQQGSNAMKRQIEVNLPSNTTLLGLDDDSGLVGANVIMNVASNVVIRNLSIESPVDWFTTWSPDDGDGAWNARFDCLSAVTSDHIWIDHVLVTDGRYPDSEAPKDFKNEPVIRHDGLLDLKDGTDFVTISNSQLKDHDKTSLLGSGDEHVDKDGGKLRVSFISNLFENTQQRGPRVRFGQVHVLNNYFVGSSKDPDYPMISQEQGGTSYFIGAGYDSRIFSEYNAFDYSGPEADESITVTSYNGNMFSDTGSWFNGEPVNLEAIAQDSFDERKAEAVAAAAESGTDVPEWAQRDFTSDVGWSPSDNYEYRTLKSPDAVRKAVLNFSGPGVIKVQEGK